MPFVAGGGNGSLSVGWFGAMVSPLLLAILVAGARATILRPYSPDDDYHFIRESMGHILYMHQVLVEEARGTYDRRLNERQDRFEETRERIAQSFRQHLAMLEPTIAKFTTAAQAIGPEWRAPIWSGWAPSNRMPRTTCVGEMLTGIREDRLSLPALIPFPHEKGLIVKADRQSRDRAISAIQSILLRLVATVPPGDLRFILIDPVGQGRNVAPFMPFADLGIGLGEGRAWTEPHQIEQRLLDLVNLIEGAAEANAFPTLVPRLDASRASGVAEPCRVLVILDFPTNIGGATARLLQVIMQKGPDSGIHPIILVDGDQTVPYGINLLELEMMSTTLSWDGRRFVWQDPDFRSSWIELDKPPRISLAKQILRGVLQPVARSA
jgi:DNA segregation ATPase FtsK/SpoIIIE, S-DNA-T family